MPEYQRLKLETIQEAVNYIRQRISKEPTIGVICGSGLGGLAETIQKKIVIKYEDIPNFPRSTVEGHVGNLVFGELGGKYVMLMQGRFHLYEGYKNNDIILPIRVMKLLGVRTVIVTNAAGGLNRTYKPGQIVIIKDHISIPCLSKNSVLIGPNDINFGERFVALNDAYSSRLRKLFKSIAADSGHCDMVNEGVYGFVVGPTYETSSEGQLLLLMGADVLGASTVPEVVVAKHAGMEVFGLSLVTNKCAFSGDAPKKTTHEEVLEVAAASSKVLQELVGKLITQMPSCAQLTLESIERSVNYIRQRVTRVPTVGVICGSGLGRLVDNLQQRIVIKYEEIPNFPRSTVEGHKGNLVFGELGDKYVMAMQGRFHSYEGYSRNELIMPIRVMKLLGVETLILTNAAGGLNRRYKLGQLVVIKDHISLPGLALKNVLVGPNDIK